MSEVTSDPGVTSQPRNEAESEFEQSIPITNHESVDSVTDYLEECNEREGDIDLGDIPNKAEATFELLQKSNALLIEIEPWFPHKYMACDEFDRWEPFIIGHFEGVIGRQIEVSNIAPLSEIAYQLQQRTKYLSAAESQDNDEKKTTHLQNALKNEHAAFTRYPLTACYNNNDETEPSKGVRIDKNPIRSVHTHYTEWPHNLIIGKKSNSLYCGRGALFDRHVDVAIEFDRYQNSHGEKKVALFNTKGTKDAVKTLDFDTCHIRYLGKKQRWEFDLQSLDHVIRNLLEHELIDYVSLHRITEKMFATFVDPSFRKSIAGYPAFDS